jgi:hypothetical protein
MKPETVSTRRPARLVYAAVLVLVTLLISVVFIKHFDAQSEESAQASGGADLTHSKPARGPAAAAASAASAASAAAGVSAASAASAEPPNPFKAFLENGKAAAPVPKKTPATQPASAAAQPADPFKAFLESAQAGAASAAQPPAASPKPQDAPDPNATDPFKEALERQQQQQH